MDYIEKVRYLGELEKSRNYDRSKYFVDIDIIKPKWKAGELEEILKDYDYVPEEYIKFIKEFDSSSITFCDFYGSKNTDIIIAEEEIAEFKEYLKYDYFPFAKDPGGGVFAFNKKQEVICFHDDDYEFEEPEKIADTFEEFVDECLMGKRLGEFLSETSKYYAFIKHLGWV